MTCADGENSRESQEDLSDGADHVDKVRDALIEQIETKSVILM